MSRIATSLPQVGDSITAALINAEYSEFQDLTNAEVDGANLGFGAVELPHLTGEICQTDAEIVNNGTQEWDNSTMFTVAATYAGPATPTPMENGLGGAVYLNRAASPIVVSSGEILRVYWQMSVRSDFDPDPWGTSVYDERSTPGTLGSEINSAWCWVTHLQYAASTSGGLPSGWTEVPGQGDFQGLLGSVYGEYLEDCPGAAVVMAWQLTDSGLGSNGTGSGTIQQITRRWVPVSGAYFHAPTSTFTAYGFRIVVHGIYHAYYRLSKNCLVLDENIEPNAELQVAQGQLMAHVLKAE